MSRSLLLFVTIIVLSLLVIGLWQSNPDNFLGFEREYDSDEFVLSAYLNNIETVDYNESGDVHYRITARKASHYQHKQKNKFSHTEIESPYITIYNKDQPPWHVKARRGISDINAKKIELEGNVTIWQINAAGEKSQLLTSTLLIKPNDQYAETDKTVIITGPNGRTEAVGMKAYMKKNIINLLSNVKSRHEPVKSST